MRVLAMLLAAPVLLATAAAQADPAPPVRARLDWKRQPGAGHCLDAAALRKAVESRLGRRVFVPAQADVVVRGRLEPARDGEGWTAQLALEGAAGQPMGKRTLSTRADDCSALDASLALIVALMIDIPREELPPPPRTTAPPPPTPQTTPIRVPRETPAPRRPWGFEADARATGAVGLMPGVGLGLGVAVGVHPPGFWFTELDGELWLPRRAYSPSGRSGSRFSLSTVDLYLCPLEPGSSRVRFRACLGQRVGRLVAEGFGFDQDDRKARLIYDPGMRIRMTARLFGPLLLGAGVGVEVPLSRDHFVASRADGTTLELYRMSPVVGTAQLLLGVGFGRR